MKKAVVLIVILLLLCLNLYAQDKPLVAVLPFQAINLSDNEAQTATILFETALVQTETFTVIEKNQIDEILEMQAFSLTGCSSQACAIEIGELLSAEQIAFGTLSHIGNEYMLTAKIVDVSLGKNVSARNISFKSLDEFTDAIFSVAYDIAGKEYIKGSGLLSSSSDFSTVYGTLRKTEIYNSFTKKLKVLDEKIKKHGGDPRTQKAEIEDLMLDIRNSDYDFLDLKEKISFFNFRMEELDNIDELNTFLAEKEVYVEQLRESESKYLLNSTIFNIVGGSSIALGCVTGTSIVLGEINYKGYQEETLTIEAERLRNNIVVFDTITLISGIATVCGGIGSIILIMQDDDRAEITEEIRKIDKEIERLEDLIND